MRRRGREDQRVGLRGEDVGDKDPAASDITRGWCRLMGLAPLMLFTTTLLVVRNQRILHAWDARQEGNQRRAAAGLPPRTRKRRRKTRRALCNSASSGNGSVSRPDNGWVGL